MAGGDVLAALRDHAYPAVVFASDLDIARAERHRRRAQACRAAYAQSAAPSRCARQHGSRAEPSLPRPLFRIFFKGMESRDVVGPGDLDPGVAVLAAAVCGPQGEVLHWVQKPVDGVQGRREPLEAMALVEGLHAALGLGITSVTVVTDNILLHNLMLGIWRSPNKMMTDMINQVMSMQRNFEQCEISHVRRSQVSFVVKLARDSILLQIAKSLAISAIEEKRETCAICMEDVDVTNIHAVEGCAHHFCFSCMKEHVKMKLLHGMLPACPKDGCTTMLSVEGSKIFLSPGLLDIMVQRVRERQIPPSKKIYCPYPKCSALMSLSELIHPMQESCSKYTGADVATLRKCVKCRGSFCISCKVPWHDGMICDEYKRRCPHARPEDEMLHNLAHQRLWRQCAKCKHMIELAEGCYHMICVCGYEFCYTCGKEWKEKKATCSCVLWDERNIIHDYVEEEEEEDDMFNHV
ncbi:hypothetical protein ACP70R_028454 [Stipagrostis hirtigluma subsp. patula]